MPMRAVPTPTMRAAVLNHLLRPSRTSDAMAPAPLGQDQNLRPQSYGAIR